MVKTNIKKYDDLPARVGVIDVDYLRFEYNETAKRTKWVEEGLSEAIRIDRGKKR